MFSMGTFGRIGLLDDNVGNGRTGFSAAFKNVWFKFLVSLKCVPFVAK